MNSPSCHRLEVMDTHLTPFPVAAGSAFGRAAAAVCDGARRDVRGDGADVPSAQIAAVTCPVCDFVTLFSRSGMAGFTIPAVPFVFFALGNSESRPLSAPLRRHASRNSRCLSVNSLPGVRRRPDPVPPLVSSQSRYSLTPVRRYSVATSWVAHTETTFSTPENSLFSTPEPALFRPVSGS